MISLLKNLYITLRYQTKIANLNLFFFFQFQRASQIRSVPFTGDSSDSESENGDLLAGRSSSHALHPDDAYDGVFRGTASRNTNVTHTTTMTSSTSGDTSLASPRGHAQIEHAGKIGQSQLKLASASALSHLKHSNLLTTNTASRPTINASTNNKLGNFGLKNTL